MITAYLKVNIGVLLALGINCYRRESESGEGFSQGCGPTEPCVRSGSIYGLVLIQPPWREV